MRRTQSGQKTEEEKSPEVSRGREFVRLQNCVICIKKGRAERREDELLFDRLALWLAVLDSNLE
ncbi:hypothetical protein Ancab_013904, partial [Ancistrocladus abbreviatus]